MRSTVEVLAHHLRCFAERKADGRPSHYRADISLSPASSQLDPLRHVCALFDSDEKEYRVLLPFIKDGFECGHRAIHVMNPQQQDQHIRRLSSAGIDTAGAQQTGQFELRSNTDRYLRDGRFDQDGVPEVFKQLTTSGAGSGFPLSRIACRMDWAAHSRTHLENLIEFESRVNHVWRRHGDAIICTCRLQQFSGDTVIDIIRTHPLVIIGGVSHQNSFFIPPEQFLPDFRERQAKQTVRNQTV